MIEVVEEPECGDPDFEVPAGGCNYGQDSFPVDDCDPGYSDTPPAPTCEYCTPACVVETNTGGFC